MFTGLIQDIGTVVSVSPGGMTELCIQTPLASDDMVLGESVAVDGVCLTVTRFGEGRFNAQAAPETLRRSTMGALTPGSKVNLERALRLSDRLGGHLVAGHVDSVAEVLSVQMEGDSRVMSFSLPEALAAFFIEKGSVTLDGVSLTLTRVEARSFAVMLIPETQARTTLGGKGVGAKVNLEADLIGKYVARLYGLRQAPASAGLSEETLRAAGFGLR